jgi:DNA-binding CsgD family transcriptional regulator
VTAVLTDKALEQLRLAGLRRPRAPHPGQEWAPRTEAEKHLLSEGYRLDRMRQLLLQEVGRLRAQLGVKGARRERIEAAARTADRLSGCPLTAGHLEVLAAAAAGETLEETARRTHVTYEAVTSQRQRAVTRLGARSITHAVALSVAAGWLPTEQIPGGAAA